MKTVAISIRIPSDANVEYLNFEDWEVESGKYEDDIIEFVGKYLERIIDVDITIVK